MTRPGRGKLLLVVLAAALLAGGCTKDPAQLYQSAQALHAKGDHAAAIVALKSALQQQPDNAAYRFMLGRLYNEVFDGASAEKELRRAADMGLVEGGRVAAELAKALLRQRNFVALAQEPAIADAFETEQRAFLHALRGHALLTLGRVPQAREQLKLSNGLAADQPEGVLLAARFRVAEGKIDEALTLVDQVLARDRKHFNAWTMRAGLMRLKRDYEGELAAYDEVLSLSPRYIDALVGRSNALLALGRIEDAQKDVNTLASTYKGHPIAIYQQGLIHLFKHRYTEALESAVTALKNRPDFGPALILAGMSHLALNSPQQAERVLSRYLAEDPRHDGVRRLLALAQVSIKQGDRAIETLRPVLQKQIRDGNVLVLASEAYQQAGDRRRAREYLAKAVDANPKSEHIAYKQALLQLEGGELDSAIADLTRSADAAKEATRADALLILALAAKGELDKALQAVEKLEQKAPRDAITHAMKGHVLSLRSDWKRARQAFEAALKLQPTYYPAAAQLAILDIRDGNTSAARKRFEAILDADAKNVNALMAIAQLDIRAGKPEDALTLLTQAVRMAPQLLEPKLRQIKLLIHMGEIARARSQAELAVQSHPDEPRALEVLTAVQMLSGQEESALSTASRRASLDRRSADAQLKLAATQFAAGDFKAAEASARQALKIDQRYAPAQEFLVALLVNRNRAAEALSLARDIQKQQAKAPSGFVLEGDVQAAQRAWPAAMEAYRKALALGGGSAVSVKLFRARYGAGDEAAAMEELEQLIAKRPDDAVLRVEMADVLLQRGDPKSAAEHYAHVVKLVPGNAQLLNNLAWAYFQSRDARAVATAEQAHALNRGDHRIADTLGWILVETGDAKRGLTLLEKAAAADPGNGNIRFHYASALAKTGEKKKARDELRRLLSSGAAFDLRKEAVALAEGLK